MACGTPVVGYADGGIPEVIDRPEVGHLFHELDPQSLATALLQAMELSKDRGVAESCRRRAEDYSRQRFGERYAALYGSLVGRR